MVQSLYKYWKFDLEDQRSEKQLSMPTLWFSSPERLNDPFECQPKFIFPADPKQEIEVLVNYLRKKYEGRDIVDLLEEALALQRGGKFSAKTAAPAAKKTRSNATIFGPPPATSSAILCSTSKRYWPSMAVRQWDWELASLDLGV